MPGPGAADRYQGRDRWRSRRRASERSHRTWSAGCADGRRRSVGSPLRLTTGEDRPVRRRGVARRRAVALRYQVDDSASLWKFGNRSSFTVRRLSKSKRNSSRTGRTRSAPVWPTWTPSARPPADRHGRVRPRWRGKQEQGQKAQGSESEVRHEESSRPLAGLEPGTSGPATAARGTTTSSRSAPAWRSAARTNSAARQATPAEWTTAAGPAVDSPGEHPGADHHGGGHHDDDHREPDDLARRVVAGDEELGVGDRTGRASAARWRGRRDRR